MCSVFISCKNIEKHPPCPHGPTLKFTRCRRNGKKEAFFACSAYRDRRRCPFFLLEGNKVTPGQSLDLEHFLSTLRSVNRTDVYNKFKDICRLDEKDRIYCQLCDVFLNPAEEARHPGHNLIKHISNHQLMHPTKILIPKTEEKAEAQYWFTSETIEVIIGALKACGAESTVCIGTPSLHETLRERGLRTLLLDVDARYSNFYGPDEFCWFNMFNCHFMNATEKESMRTLTEQMKYSCVAVVLDPPFGARLEPLSRTLNILNAMFKEASGNSSAELKIFLALPYFMETHIKNDIGDLGTLDYVVEYTNKAKFGSNPQSSVFSPVRLFTNVSLSIIPLPEEEGYLHCDECERWVGHWSKHCELCKNCPPNRNAPYVHCNVCKKCVLGNWSHCEKCNRCTHKNHSCKVFEASNGFRIDNTDHIIDVNKGNIPFEYDQVNIICPTYPPGTHEEDAEKYIIYNVSKEEYDTCRITNRNPRSVAVCDTPYKLMYFTISFRPFTPMPGGLEFQPGQDYYFISTSSKEDLHRRIGGRCSSNNMKVVFKVCCRPEDTQNNSVGVGQDSTSLVSVGTTTAVTQPPLRTSQTTVSATVPTWPTPPSNTRSSTKKTKIYEKHPNEVVKNEELTYNNGHRIFINPLLLLYSPIIFVLLVGL